MKMLAVAKICHEANKAYCESIGDFTQPSWLEAPEWQKESALKGVEFHMQKPKATPSDSHESWLSEKRAAGWKYGEVKDAAKKEHPCFVDYDKLPESQRAKDYLFKGIVDSLRSFIK